MEIKAEEPGPRIKFKSAREGIAKMARLIELHLALYEDVKDIPMLKVRGSAASNEGAHQYAGWLKEELGKNNQRRFQISFSREQKLIMRRRRDEQTQLRLDAKMKE